MVYGNKTDRTGYAWVLNNVEKINSREPVSGKQGIWNIDKI